MGTTTMLSVGLPHRDVRALGHAWLACPPRSPRAQNGTWPASAHQQIPSQSDKKNIKATCTCPSEGCGGPVPPSERGQGAQGKVRGSPLLFGLYTLGLHLPRLDDGGNRARTSHPWGTAFSWGEGAWPLETALTSLPNSHEPARNLKAKMGPPRPELWARLLILHWQRPPAWWAQQAPLGLVGSLPRSSASTSCLSSAVRPLPTARSAITTC